MTGILDEVDFDGEEGRQQANAEPMERANSIEHLAADEQGEQVILDDATLEPAAPVEAGGEYAQAEAIQAAMMDLVDEAQEEAAEGGKRAFGQDTVDPKQHYSGVHMAPGEVETDQDWNEGDNAPPTEEVMVEGHDTSISGGAEALPLEAISNAASQTIARVFIEDGFHDRLMEGPDAVLAEHGLNRDDLPDLSDPDTPEAEAFIRDVQRRVVEGVSLNRPDGAGRDLSPDDAAHEMRWLALQLEMDQKNQTEKTVTTVIKKFQNTTRELVSNLK